MSSGNKVYKYRCNVCQRDVEQVSDNRRPNLLRCVITDLCRGTLEPTGSRRGDRARLTTPQADLADRVPRGSTLTITPAPADPVLIGLTTFAGANGLTISAPKREVVGPEAIYTIKDIDGLEFELERRIASTLYPTNSRVDVLVYELTAAVLQSSKYTFTFSNIAQVVEGIDDSKEQRLLRFSTTDNLTILVNGVELQPSEYDRSEADTIRLTPGISAAELTVEVYVFKDRSQLIDENKLIRLPCVPLSETDEDEAALRSGCAWGDTARLVVAEDNMDRSLLFCTDLSKLEERKTYSVARFEAVSALEEVRIIDPTEVWLLLSDAPHSFVDKRLDEVINGDALVEQQFSFTYDLSEATGSQVPVAGASALTLLSVRLAPAPEASVEPVSTEGAERAYVKRAEAYIIGPA
jgi:hypothetical protein